MPLYPTVEDLKVAELVDKQDKVIRQCSQSGSDVYAKAAGYMGLTLENFHYNEFGELVPGPAPICEVSYPPAPSAPITPAVPAAPASSTALVAPSGAHELVPSVPGLGEIQHGVRRVTLCKDAAGKAGLQLRDVDTGVFVSFVQANSPAALAGLRFGDQVLSIRDRTVAGFSGNKAMELIRSGPVNNIVLIVRDRPFERRIQLHKDSHGHLGITLQDGMIKCIHKDSSAARNGVLTNHKIAEINGQNVLGLSDKILRELIDRTPSPVSLTVMPRMIYEHMVSKLHGKQLRREMDRSLPDV